MRVDLETELINKIATFTHDPLGFVLFAFDWGVGPLVEFPNGPDSWQREILTEIAQQLRAGISATEAIQIAGLIAAVRVRPGRGGPPVENSKGRAHRVRRPLKHIFVGSTVGVPRNVDLMLRDE